MFEKESAELTEIGVEAARLIFARLTQRPESNVFDFFIIVAGLLRGGAVYGEMLEKEQLIKLLKEGNPFDEMLIQMGFDPADQQTADTESEMEREPGIDPWPVFKQMAAITEGIAWSAKYPEELKPSTD